MVARLAELKQHAESEHARPMAPERARTAEARRINQARSGENEKLKEQERKLRADKTIHKEAAKSQQQGAEEQSTQWIPRPIWMLNSPSRENLTYLCATANDLALAVRMKCLGTWIYGFSKVSLKVMGTRRRRCILRG